VHEQADNAAAAIPSGCKRWEKELN